ncbi:MAG TPA: DUF3618 domain-containing protein [Micromonosporaceae bacterium]|nr:DUF3618 domain-containing protein [Micromonosporaceae bacterium]
MTTGNGRGDAEALRAEIAQTREELGDTVQALAAKADVKARVRESAAQTKARVRQRAAETTAQLREQATHASAEARRAPVPWVAVAAGAVAAIVAVVVLSRRRR